MWPADPRAQAGERHQRADDSTPVPSPRVDEIAAFRLPHVAPHDAYGSDHVPCVVHGLLCYHDTTFLRVLFDPAGSSVMTTPLPLTYTPQLSATLVM